MPCYQVNLISVEFKGTSKEILKKIGARFYSDNVAFIDSVEINLANGTAEAPTQSAINEVKQKYSIETVKSMAKKQVWQTQQKGNKLTLTKW